MPLLTGDLHCYCYNTTVITLHLIFLFIMQNSLMKIAERTNLRLRTDIQMVNGNDSSISKRTEISSGRKWFKVMIHLLSTWMLLYYYKGQTVLGGIIPGCAWSLLWYFLELIFKLLKGPQYSSRNLPTASALQWDPNFQTRRKRCRDRLLCT